MIKYRAVLIFENGERVEDDELCDTFAEAEERASEMRSDYHTGTEVLHASNPFENPEDDPEEEIEDEIEEVEVDSEGNEL